MSDNNFMKVTKQRNPYLKRAFSNQAHKYSYDIDSGKYHLLSKDGTETVISKIGTFTPKFRKDFSGFATSHQRYQAAKLDQTALHFTPDLGFKTANAYYTPMTKKFMGYAQQPYKVKGKKFPQFLTKSEDPHQFKTNRTLTKSQSQNKQKIKTKGNQSLILQHSSNTFANKQINDHYFQLSFANMTDSKPLPKFQKKTCYNYRCKFMKHYTFDEKGKTEASTKFANTRSILGQNTLAKSFYDKHIDLQNKQLACLQSQRA